MGWLLQPRRLAAQQGQPLSESIPDGPGAVWVGDSAHAGDEPAIQGSQTGGAPHHLPANERRPSDVTRMVQPGAVRERLLGSPLRKEDTCAAGKHKEPAERDREGDRSMVTRKGRIREDAGGGA